MDKIPEAAHKVVEVLGGITEPKVTAHEHEVQDQVAQHDKEERLEHEHQHEVWAQHKCQKAKEDAAAAATTTTTTAPVFHDAQEENKATAATEAAAATESST